MPLSFSFFAKCDSVFIKNLDIYCLPSEPTKSEHIAKPWNKKYVAFKTEILICWSKSNLYVKSNLVSIINSR